MITIKRNGAMHYYGICPECNAQLEFNKTDIINEKIWCHSAALNPKQK